MVTKKVNNVRLLYYFSFSFHLAIIAFRNLNYKNIVLISGYHCKYRNGMGIDIVIGKFIQDHMIIRN